MQVTATFQNKFNKFNKWSKLIQGRPWQKKVLRKCLGVVNRNTYALLVPLDLVTYTAILHCTGECGVVACGNGEKKAT